MFNRYKVELTFDREMLGTNPCNPNILDTHIINKQRDLILEKGSKVNLEVNKYLDQIQISKDKGDEEVKMLFDKLEKLTGVKLDSEDKKLAVEGKLESLKETFAELDLVNTTIFLWDKKTNKPCISDHMIYGFMKAAADAISKTLPKKKGTLFHSAVYTQGIINQHVRCADRYISFDRDTKKTDSGNTYFEQRSLRAQTAQGPRISLAKSEVMEAGAKLSFTLKIMKGSKIDDEKALNRLFSYGELSGLGQWRNAGWGQFRHKLTPMQ